MSDLSTAQDAGIVADEATQQASTTETVETNPEAVTDTEQEAKEVPAEKTFTQAELNEHIQRAKAKAEAKAERRATQAYKEALEAVTKPQQVQQGRPEPTRDQFASDAEWIDAKVDYKLQQHSDYRRESEGARAARDVQSKAKEIYAQAEKSGGFDRETFDDLPVSQVMADVVMESDVAAQLMAFMSKNPAEVERIARLSPVKQAVELGKLETKIQQAPKISKAPPPISPIGNKGSVSTSLANSDFATYKAERAKQGAKWSR